LSRSAPMVTTHIIRMRVRLMVTGDLATSQTAYSSAWGLGITRTGTAHTLARATTGIRMLRALAGATGLATGTVAQCMAGQFMVTRMLMSTAAATMAEATPDSTAVVAMEADIGKRV